MTVAAPAREPMTGSQRAALMVATLALGTDMLVYGLAIPVLPRLASQYGTSTGALGVMFASYALTMLLVSPLVGRWLDRRGPRMPMLLGLAGLAGSCILFALASDALTLVLARVLQGASAAVSWTAAFALIASRFAPGPRGAALGIAFAGVGAGTLLGPPLGGLLFQHVGERAPFIAAGILCLVDGVVRYRLVEDPPTQSHEAVSLASFMASRGAWRLIALTAVGAAALSFFEPVLPGRIAAITRADATTVGVLFAVAVLISTALTPAIGAASYRLPSAALPITGAGLLIAGGLALAQATGTIVFGIGLAFIAVAAACILTPTLSLMSHLAERRRPPAYGSAYALYTIAYVAGLAVGPLAAGWLTMAGGFGTAATAAAIALALLAIALATTPTAKSPVRE